MNVELKIVLLSIVAAIVFIGSGVIVVQMKKPECPSDSTAKRYGTRHTQHGWECIVSTTLN
jgi:hypothetical protein